MHRPAAVLAYSDHSARTLPLTEGVPSLFGNSAVVAVPTTTLVPCTVICAMALLRSTGCTGIFRSSSVRLIMLEAPAHVLVISPSEWPPPYLALDVVHVGQSCILGTQPRLRQISISFSSAATQSLPVYPRPCPACPGAALLSHPSR